MFLVCFKMKKKYIFFWLSKYEKDLYRQVYKLPKPGSSTLWMFVLRYTNSKWDFIFFFYLCLFILLCFFLCTFFSLPSLYQNSFQIFPCIFTFIYISYCKDATNTGYRIRPGPSKMKPRFNPSLTPESAGEITKKEEKITKKEEKT